MPDPNVTLIPAPAFSFSVENGGRTWARMLTPVIAENGKDPNAFNPDPDDPFPGDPAEGHGWGDYGYSRTYSDKCYGLARGLTGWQAGRPWSNFFAGWYSDWQFFYDAYDPQNSYWQNMITNDVSYDFPSTYYDSGTISVGFYAHAGFPSSIHWFDQDEMEEMLTGATLETNLGPLAFTTDWLKKYFNTQDTSLVTYSTGVPWPGSNYFPLQGITDINL